MQIERYEEKYADRQSQVGRHRYTDRLKGRQMNRQLDRQMDGQICRQPDRMAR